MQILRDISKSKLFFSIKLLFGVCKRSSELTKMPFLYNLHPEKTGSNKKQVPVNFSNGKSWINISFGIPTIVPLLTLSKSFNRFSVLHKHTVFFCEVILLQ